MSDDLYTDVRILTETVNSLDDNVGELDPEPMLYSNLIAFAAIEEARKNLAVVAHDLEQKLAKVMPKQLVVDGAGTFECHKKKARTAWDKDDLLRAVLDTRLVNKDTGEVKEETPLEKVLAVFNLPSPRLTALRDRGLDPDEYCHTEDTGYAIRLIA